MRHLVKLLPTALLVLLTKVWPSLGQALRGTPAMAAGLSDHV